jgi:hypothetical protein
MFSVLLGSIRLVTQRNAWLPFSMCGPGTRRSSWELSKHRATVYRQLSCILHTIPNYLSLSPRPGVFVGRSHTRPLCWSLCASLPLSHTHAHVHCAASLPILSCPIARLLPECFAVCDQVLV